MTPAEILAAIRALELEDVAQLRNDVTAILSLKVAQSRAARQATCAHVRAKEGEFYSGLVTWHCPDCGASRTISHHRERGAQ